MSNKTTLKELYNIRKHWLMKNRPYQLSHFSEWDYSTLKEILYRKKAGRGSNQTVNDCFIMVDTETSKKSQEIVSNNHIVAWTISIRAFDMNIVTLYGQKPSDCASTINKIMQNLQGEQTIFYVHNLAYDWVFLRKFLFAQFGLPNRQLNTKSHYPILIEWECGFILKDSLILAQRSLDKWAKDLDVEHKKALGKWDYDKIRNQSDILSPDELEYIEHDTLAGVECLDKLRLQLNKQVYSMPYTATGIPREDVRNLAKSNNGKDRFNSMCLGYDQYIKAEKVYHGGYTHANRYLIDTLISETVTCYDFASSYPFVLLSEKYPMEKFTKWNNCDIDFIIRNINEYVFMFKLILVNVSLKDYDIPMPALQFSKCVHIINPILDNGRILQADYLEIYLTELDLDVIVSQYDYSQHICTEVELAIKDYLPRWFTDYIFSLFEAKTKLKGGDPVAYALAKAKLNSVYGMCVQKSIKQTINEQYLTGEYIEEVGDPEELYDKYLKNRNSILPYQWGVWVTAYAFRNLFKLGQCCETWVYSDTDSCYGINWNQDKISTYNQQCVDKLKLMVMVQLCSIIGNTG